MRRGGDEVLGERMENVNKMNLDKVCVQGGLKVDSHYPCQQSILVVDCESIICRDYNSIAFMSTLLNIL